MKHSVTQIHAMMISVVALGVLAVGPAVAAGDDTTVRLSLKDHRFQPGEAQVPAGKPITIEVRNLDTTPSEFESKTLRVEKVVAGGGVITLQIRALQPGRYLFYDDFHEDTAKGFLVVQ
jgi:hypothetical protein